MAWNNAPILIEPVYSAKTRTSRSATVLGILRKQNCPLNSIAAKTKHPQLKLTIKLLSKTFEWNKHILLHFLQRLLWQRIHVPKGHVMLVRSGLRWHLIQLLAEQFPLRIGPFENRRATSNLAVFLLDLRSTSASDPWSQTTNKTYRSVLSYTRWDTSEYYKTKCNPARTNLWKGSWIMSRSVMILCRYSPTLSVVCGPPMFIITMAVFGFVFSCTFGCAATDIGRTVVLTHCLPGRIARKIS